MGYTFIATALAAGLATKLFGSEDGWGYAIAGFALLLGAFLIFAASALRIWKGDVRLRPFQAAKQVLVIFPVLMGLHFVFFYFGWSDRSLQEALLLNGLLSAFWAFWFTAHRKSAF